MLDNFKTTDFTQIVLDAKERGDEACKFLRSIVDKEVEVEKEVDGKMETKKRKASFLAVKRAYFEKYYPDLLPKAKAKSMDQILKEYGF